jgi:hypothetical protein
VLKRGRGKAGRERRCSRQWRKKRSVLMLLPSVGKKIRAPGIREQRRRGKEISQGLMRDFRKLQGLIYKAKFPINLKPE